MLAKRKFRQTTQKTCVQSMFHLNSEKASMNYYDEFIEAFAVKWKVEMEALGVQPYLTTYVFLIALAAEARHTLEMCRNKRKGDSE